MSTSAQVPAPPQSGRRRNLSRYEQKVGIGFPVKLILVAIVDALGLYGIFALGQGHQWWPLAAMAAGLVIVNVVYFHPRFIAAKYLVPGLIFLLVYQVFVVLYTGYAAFTNYGDGHNSTKADAISALQVANEERVPDSPQYPLTVVVKGGEIGFLVVNPADNKAEFGTATEPLAPAPEATVDGGRAVALPGWQSLKLTDILSQGLQQQVTSLRVAISSDVTDGSLRSPDGTNGFVFRSVLVYDPAADTMMNAATQVVYRPTAQGNFAAPDGSVLEPGWKVYVGFQNFTRVLTDSSLRGPFLGVFIWTFVFAALSVLGSLIIGLFLAVVLNDTRMRGRKVYRSLLLLPYAFPAFLSGLVWAGLLNSDFGWINQVLLGGAQVNWLGDPWLARLSVVLVNCWLGFPYMFLVCTGALQAIPPDLVEAGSMDGAGPWQIFRRLKMPLLLVSIAPLLISSFAFNFNNFNTVYMLTAGGPKNLDASVDVGYTDILISFVYKLAFGGTNRQYGFASAVSILIFIVVAVISAISFRKTKALEELS